MRREEFAGVDDVPARVLVNTFGISYLREIYCPAGPEGMAKCVLIRSYVFPFINSCTFHMHMGTKLIIEVIDATVCFFLIRTGTLKMFTPWRSSLLCRDP